METLWWARAIYGSRLEPHHTATQPSNDWHTWLDHGGSWVQIPSGARIFSEFSKDLIYHVFVVSSFCTCLLLFQATIDVQQHTQHIESNIKRCLMAYKRITGICPAYINELIQLNNSQHSRNTRGANFSTLPRKYTREKEGGRTFSVSTSRCWNHLPLRYALLNL